MLAFVHLHFRALLRICMGFWCHRACVCQWAVGRKLNTPRTIWTVLDPNRCFTVAAWLWHHLNHVFVCVAIMPDPRCISPSVVIPGASHQRLHHCLYQTDMFVSLPNSKERGILCLELSIHIVSMWKPARIMIDLVGALSIWTLPHSKHWFECLAYVLLVSHECMEKH